MNCTSREVYEDMSRIKYILPWEVLPLEPSHAERSQPAMDLTRHYLVRYHLEQHLRQFVAADLMFPVY